MLVSAFFSVYELLLIFFRNWVGSHKKYRFLNFLNRFFTGCLQGKMSVLPNIYLYKLKRAWFALRFSATRRKLQPPFSWIRETTFVFVLSWLFLQLCLFFLWKTYDMVSLIYHGRFHVNFVNKNFAIFFVSR